MARSLPLLMLVVVVLVPAPLVLSAIPSSTISKIGRYAVRAEQTRKIRKFLTEHAGDVLGFILDIFPSSGGKKGDDKQGSAAATTAGLYMFNLSIGTSAPQIVTGILDIGLNFIWAQCAPCDPCLALPAPTFQPNMSATFSTLPCASQTCQSALNQTCGAAVDDTCGYLIDYGDGTNTTGYLADDTFVFGPSAAPGVVFGCSDASAGDFSGASGAFGFGRGNLSLVTQLQVPWFSYLLASDDYGGDSGLQFGDGAAPRSKRSHSTPLLQSSMYPDLYYVKLIGIQVSGQELTGIPAGTFDLRADGSGGVFLSTTIPATYLEQAAYEVVKQAFRSGIPSEPVNGSAVGLDLCYMKQSLDEIKIPTLTLVFDGTNAAMELKEENYFFTDSSTGLECLSILPFQGVSLLGNLLQMDTTMTYDIYGGQLIFETALAPPPHLMVSVMMAAVQLVAWALLLF